MAVTGDGAVAEGIRLLRNHGGSSTYVHQIVGTNSRLDALQAAVLRVKLKYLDRRNEQRRARAAYYTEQFAEVPEVVTPAEHPSNYHIYHQYVIRLPRRDAAQERLTKRGVGCAVFYPVPLHQQECFRPYGSIETRCSQAERASREVLALPMFPELTPEQQDEVVAAVKDHIAHI
jgi:dTDP-4-amino-4,6-dideoxygalactose transaminase